MSEQMSEMESAADGGSQNSAERMGVRGFCKYFFLSAVALTFSCSTGGDGGGTSSTKKEQHDFCVSMAQQMCLVGPFVSCAEGWSLSNNCPYTNIIRESSSSTGSLTGESSSSLSVEPSSSSSEIPSSSSSGEPVSSSSVLPVSSSSEIPSSSSIEPSSSSSEPPSSSSLSVEPSSSSSSSVLPVSSSSEILSSSSIEPSSSSSVVRNVVYGDPVEYMGETYQTVVIGEQTWFARNLNYAVDGSRCYNDQNSYCTTYGRMYNWATAMALPSECNSSECAEQVTDKHQGICPSGWHIPSGTDWQTLINFVDGTSLTSPAYSATAGRYLKAVEGWNDNGNGEDIYGFTALPGGCGFFYGTSCSVGNTGGWWSASESGTYYAVSRYMYYDDEYTDCYDDNKVYLFSVRCVKD